MEVLVNIRMLRNAVFIVVLIVPMCLLMASTDGAILMSTGTVQINGGQAAGSSTVFPGDRVQTAPNASAFVKSPSALVSIGGDSAVTYDGTSVTLEHGVVAVTVDKRMDARLMNLLISADPGHTAKFQLLSANGIERIADIDGSLTVTDGLHVAKLSAGEMITYEPASKEDDTRSHHKKGLAHWKIELMIEGGIAAGVIGGLAATGALSGRPASPAHP